MKRREFFLQSALALNAFAGTTKKTASDRVKLGPMGVPLSRLAMGTGTNGSGGSSNQTKRLGLSGVADLFRAGFDQGVTFWDSADQYGTHPHLKEALKGVAREKVTIMTKTSASTEKEMRAELDRYRREKGIVKTHGTSCHTLDALKTAARTPWVQVDLARINPAGVAMDADRQTVIFVLRQMKAAGKGIIGMKILGAGKLRDKADECLQFALSLDCVDCMTSGRRAVRNWETW